MKSNRVAVIASASTELRPAWSGAQHIDLISAVVTEVFKGTGLDLDDVDFVLDSGSDVLDGRSISNCGFLGALGAHHKEESRVEEDGLWAALYGVTKIASGAASLGLIVAYSKSSEADVDLYYAAQCEPFYQRPVGFDHKAASGIQAQRYLSHHGLGNDLLARVCAKRWAAAARQGKVQMTAPPSPTDVLAAPNAAAPLTSLMMSRPVDGAVAVLLADEDIARRASRTPVWITGLGASMDRHSFAARKPNALEACEIAARRAFGNAGWQRAPKALVAEVSGSSAAGELMVLESVGLAAAGHAVELLDDDGATVNLSGGALPADPIMATGLIRLSEAVRQLSYPDRYEIKQNSAGLVHATGGVGMQTHCVVTLEV
jgi:acetyl-CoA C-acetyltransferase